MDAEHIRAGQGDGRPVAVYTDCEDTGRFSCGYISAVTQDELLLSAVSPAGRYDGFLIVRTEDVFALERDSRYTDKIDRLYRARGQRHPAVEVGRGESLTAAVLRHAQREHMVVTIELWDSGLDDVQGFVGTVGDKTVTIRQLDDGGKSGGEIEILPEAITALMCDEENGQALKILWEAGQGNGGAGYVERDRQPGGA